MDNDKVISIEDLAKDFEERLLDNKYYEDVTINYRGSKVKCRIRPIPNFEFKRILKGKDMSNSDDAMNFNSEICAYSLLNKNDNKPFKKEDIERVFPAGILNAITEQALMISGLIDESQKAQMELFLKQNAQL